MKHCMYQVSTLQALVLGYTKSVIDVQTLLEHGDTGLGTFEDVNGEMITLDGACFRAMEDGRVIQVSKDAGVPFSCVTHVKRDYNFELDNMESMAQVNEQLTVHIEKHFGLNSMHVVRIDGLFQLIKARSEAPYKSQHISLKDILSKTQKEFQFANIEGTLVCVYFPDYMDGIDAPGWHLHFVSKDKKWGGMCLNVASKKDLSQWINWTVLKFNFQPIQLLIHIH